VSEAQGCNGGLPSPKRPPSRGLPAELSGQAGFRRTGLRAGRFFAAESRFFSLEPVRYLDAVLICIRKILSHRLDFRRKETESNLKFEIQNCGQSPVFWCVAKAQKFYFNLF